MKNYKIYKKDLINIIPLTKQKIFIIYLFLAPFKCGIPIPK